MTDPTAVALSTQLLREPWDASLAGVLADRLEEIGHPKAGALREWFAVHDCVARNLPRLGRRAKRRLLKETRQLWRDAFPDLLVEAEIPF